MTTAEERAPRPPAGVFAISLTGELDIDRVDEIRDVGNAALKTPGVQTLVFDLAAVTFMDSSAIGVLVELRQVAAERGLRFRLDHVTPPVHRVLELTGLLSLLELGGDPLPRGQHGPTVGCGEA